MPLTLPGIRLGSFRLLGFAGAGLEQTFDMVLRSCTVLFWVAFTAFLDLACGLHGQRGFDGCCDCVVVVA